MLDRVFVRAMFIVSVVPALVPGLACQSQNASTEADASVTVKPIERVRAGIVQVDQELGATLISAEAAAQSGNLKGFRESFRATEASVQTLREDAGELRRRADEYLALWSGRKVGVADDGYVQVVTDPQWRQRKAKYDEMVTALQQARDDILPLMSDLDRLQAGSNAQGPQEFTRDVQRARATQKRAAGNLQTGVARLDELKAMLAAQNNSPSK